MANAISKVCSSCEEDKPLSDFHSHKQGKFGTRSKCKVCYNKVTQIWREQNPDKVHQYTMTSRNRNREGYRATYNKWQSQNRDRKNAKEASRRATKVEASPQWLSKEQKDDIQAMYSLAKKFGVMCGIEYHVDHIVPLKGKDVCGLHVPWNLQLLPAAVNIKKSNNFLGEL